MWAAIIGAILGVGSSVVGTIFSRIDSDKQRAILDKVAEAYGGVIPPEVKQEMAEQLGPSAFEALGDDKQNMARQNAAYDALEREYSQPGGSDIARAEDMRAQAAAGNIAGSLDASNMSRMHRRGLGGSGLEAIMGQASAQAGANRAADMEVQAAADAQKRRMQALEAAGQMAGSMRSQGFNEKSERARAIDAMNRANAGLRWDAKKYNNAQDQLAFDNRMKLLAAQNAAKAGQVGWWGGAADRDQETGDNIGAALAQTGNAVGKYYDSSSKKKKDDDDGEWV